MSTVIYYKDNDTVVKIYYEDDDIVRASEIIMLTTYFEPSMRVVKDIVFNEGDCAMKVYMKRGGPCGLVGLEDITDLIRHLASMEANGIIHGDIKGDNIVRIGGRLRMIDFGVLTTRFENDVEVQSYKDEHGHAYKKGYISGEYSAMKQAMYALGLTICFITNLVPISITTANDNKVIKIREEGEEGEEEGEEGEGEEVKEEVIEVTVPYYVHYFKENVDKLCNTLPMLDLLIRDPPSRAQSFWQLLKDDTTRVIYDKCVSGGCTCKQVAMMIEGYFRTGLTDSASLVKATRGSCFFSSDEQNFTLRLLREYHEPGSWYLPCGKCNSIEELRSLITSQSPKYVTYCFDRSTSRVLSTKGLVSTASSNS